MATRDLRLRDGDSVAVIGAGPAGALFTHFLLRYASSAGLRLAVTLFDGRMAEQEAQGCSLSAGVLAQDFLAALQAAGLYLPDEAVQSRLAGYLLETPHGSVHIAPPAGAVQPVAVFRGAGLRATLDRDGVANFDQRILDQVRGPNVAVIPCYIRGVRLGDASADPVSLSWYSSGREQSASFALVAVACGLNSGLPRQLTRLGFGYREPEWLPSVQGELGTGQIDVAQRLNGAAGVYLLNLPGIRFAALTPKRRYVTATLVGENAGEEALSQFLRHPVVRRRLGGLEVEPQVLCRCRPRALEEPAVQPYTDRLVMVGDTAVSRLYKNGLYSALVTARAAAATAIYQGIGQLDFARRYARVCGQISRDNRRGRFLFRLYEYPLKYHPALADRLLRALAAEQVSQPEERRRSSILMWHLLSGDRPYGQLGRELLSPLLYWQMLRHGL
ncbi:MAG: hypothetical protein ACYC4L_02145 [Chloroflexota bacterium]